MSCRINIEKCTRSLSIKSMIESHTWSITFRKPKLDIQIEVALIIWQNDLINISDKCTNYRGNINNLKVYPEQSVKKRRRIISAEKRSFCLQRSVFFTTIVVFIWLLENPVRTISASFGRSRSGNYREIRPTYLDFLFANAFQWEFLCAAFFLRFAVNIP